MCLRDLIFRVFLEDFISEVLRKWQRDQMFKVLLDKFGYKFCEQMTSGANVFCVSYHWFCIKAAAEAIAMFF